MAKGKKQSLVSQFDEDWTEEREKLTQQLIQAKYSRQFSRKAGRPTVLTLTLVERFLTAARQGLPIEICCDYALIDRELFYAWKQRNDRILKRIEPIMQRFYDAEANGEIYKFSKDELKSLRLSPNEELLIEFFHKITQVKSENAQRLMVGLNQAAMLGNTNAAVWLLKTSFPEHYGEQQNKDVSEENDVGFAYIEINAVSSNNPYEDEREEKNITPSILNGEIDSQAENIQ